VDGGRNKAIGGADLVAALDLVAPLDQQPGWLAGVLP
jgi:hypothetical protein